jgi:hypothetical protein
MYMAFRIVGLACLALATVAMANQVVWPLQALDMVPGWMNALATLAGLAGFVLTRAGMVACGARHAGMRGHPHG